MTQKERLCPHIYPDPLAATALIQPLARELPYAEGVVLKKKERKKGRRKEMPAYTTATTVQDPSCVCDLHHSSQQHQIFNPLSKARNHQNFFLKCLLNSDDNIYQFFVIT